MEQISKEKAKEKLKELIDDFEDYLQEVDKLSETSIRTSYIDRLFEILGWDIRNPRETILEEQGKEGRLDYLLKLGNKEVFVIEAKKTKINLSIGNNSGIKSAKQGIMYAWHKNCKFAVITNFKELKVFHALFKPRDLKKHLISINSSGYFTLGYNEFLEKFDLLWLLSKESFLNGELEKYLSKKDVKISKPVDETILEDLFHYREWLSKDIKNLNPYLAKQLQDNREEQEIIDEAVQHLIDRLIFIRSTEDRGLEDEDRLLKLNKDFKEMRLKKRLFFELIDIFEEFDKRYNSKLFEKSFIDTKLKISDEVLTKVINGLYFGTDSHTEKYNFKEISVDLLGSIYEQYLGIILRTTELRAKLKSGVTKRKKMGIYYTPSYIVDYIVQNTIGEIVKNKSLDEISKLKILDPACGSGSFLQSAFSFMANEIKERIKKGEKSKLFPALNFELANDHLILAQKIQVLVNNILGVDLDEKAVEIAQLSLLLKLLEGEGAKTKKRLLPAMTDNIKWGNSLIENLSITDRAFNWKSNFKDIFTEGGFNVVIGNPPYVDSEEMTRSQPELRKEYTKIFESAKGNWDLFCLFIEQGIKLLKEGGYFGMIIPNKLLSADYSKSLRNFIYKHRIVSIRDYSKIPVFQASVYPIVIIVQKTKPIKNKILVELMEEENGILNVSYSNFVEQNSLEDKNTWSLILEEGSELLDRIVDKSDRLKDITDVSGASTVSEAYEIKKVLSELENKNRYFRFINTGTIDRYASLWGIKPTTYIKSKYENPIIQKDKLKKFSKNRFLQAEKSKIIIAGMTKRLECYIDSKGDYLAGKSTTVVSSDKINLKFLLGVLNSKLMTFVYKKMFKSLSLAGGFMRVGTPQIKELPIKNGTEKEQEKIIEKVDRLLDLNEKYVKIKESSTGKDRLKQQIEQTDYEIDELVYNLYGLNKEEKEIIEKSS